LALVGRAWFDIAASLVQNSLIVEFFLGLYHPETGGIMQLYSPDISWMNLILRYGIVGTLLYLIGFFRLIGSFIHRNRAFFLCGLMIFFNSIVSDCLYSMIFIVPMLILSVSGGGNVREDT
jgi:hypothetical protein